MSGFRQRGMTIWSLMVVACVMGFFALLIIKLAPPYATHAKVTFALKSAVRQVGGSSAASAAEVRQALERRFDIDEIRTVNLKEALRFERARSGILTARLAYEVRVPILYNVSAVIAFDESADFQPN